MPNDYLPRNEQELAAWAEGYKIQINNYAPTLGLSSAQVGNVTNLVDNYNRNLDNANRLAEQYHSAVAAKELSKDLMVSAIRVQVNVLKNSENYSYAVGNGLNIIAPEAAAVDFTTLKPTAKLTKSVQGVKISYTKKGMDGVIAYCRRGGEQNFTLMDKFTLRVGEEWPLVSPRSRTADPGCGSGGCRGGR